jgi:hypothetical protein
LQVDEESPARGVAHPGATLLNTNARLWIGESLFQKLNLEVGPYSSFYIRNSGTFRQLSFLFNVKDQDGCLLGCSAV